MERLTEHHVNKTLGAYMVCSGACIDDNFDCNGCKKLEEMVDRLAAYEDTGLGPEEITTEPYGCVFYCNRKCNLDGDFCAEGPGCPYEINAETAKHLLELAKAEKDGRLVVLPCKVGDKVKVDVNSWGNVWNYKTYDFGKFLHGEIVSISITKKQFLMKIRVNHNVYWKRPMKRYPISAIGKTVFLTREEAEAALKKREEKEMARNA